MTDAKSQFLYVAKIMDGPHEGEERDIMYAYNRIVLTKERPVAHSAIVAKRFCVYKPKIVDKKAQIIEYWYDEAESDARED